MPKRKTAPIAQNASDEDSSKSSSTENETHNLFGTVDTELYSSDSEQENVIGEDDSDDNEEQEDEYDEEDEGASDEEEDVDDYDEKEGNDAETNTNENEDINSESDNLNSEDDEFEEEVESVFSNSESDEEIQDGNHKIAEQKNSLKSSSDRKSLQKTNHNEYEEHDTSDEEDIRNTVGNIPLDWYEEYKHTGFDWDGNKILKPPKKDQLDIFLQKIENPDFWRTVKDPQTGQDVVLSDEDIKLIRRIQGNKIPDETFDEYAPWIEWFTNEVMKHPLRNFPEHKRSFLPSRHEAKKVSKLVHALKMGWIKTKEEEEKLKKKTEPQFYMLWQSDDKAEDMRRIHKHIPAPKRRLPGHAESYNPPPEYLFDQLELKQWNKQANTPWKRKLHFVPQKHSNLRNVPAYPRFIKERFTRCLDLYLCPRAIKMKLQVEPEDLIPKLPSPRDLQPFPAMLAGQYKGHTDMVRTIDTEKLGEYLASGSDDCTVKIWEINNRKCVKTLKFDAVIESVKWCPNTAISLILVAAGNKVVLINPNVSNSSVCSTTDNILKDSPKNDDIINERIRTAVQWKEPTAEEYEKGFRVILEHFKPVNQVLWHGKGDYFACIMKEGQNRSVIISSLSKRRSQLGISKPKGRVQCVMFHPFKPQIFVATQQSIRIFDLVEHCLVKKLVPNTKWISSMDIHPGGDNVIVGTYDNKVLWFDLEYNTTPYQTLKLHGKAVRDVCFHKRYPLFASVSDDRSLIVSHGMVYNDLGQNALIVPLKKMQDHESVQEFGVFAVHFHPIEPWVFSAGADGTIKLYS